MFVTVTRETNPLLILTDRSNYKSTSGDSQGQVGDVRVRQQKRRGLRIFEDVNLRRVDEV